MMTKFFFPVFKPFIIQSQRLGLILMVLTNHSVRWGGRVDTVRAVELVYMVNGHLLYFRCCVYLLALLQCGGQGQWQLRCNQDNPNHYYLTTTQIFMYVCTYVHMYVCMYVYSWIFLWAIGYLLILILFWPIRLMYFWLNKEEPIRILWSNE